MMKRLFIIPLLIVLMVTACAPTASEQPAVKQSSGPLVTVYHPPT